MKIKLNKLFWLIVFLISLIAVLKPVNAQVSNQYWKALSGVLQPVINTYQLKIPQLGGSGIKCLQTDNEGLLSPASAACGSGGGSGGSSAFSTSTAWGSILRIFPNNLTDLFLVGYSGSGVATSSNAEFVIDPTAKLASFLNNTKLGIGTSNPVSPLHVSIDGTTASTSLISSDDFVITKNSAAAGNTMIVAGDVATQRGVFKSTRARNTVASPTAPQAEDYVFSLLGSIFDGVTTRATAGIEMIVDGAVSSGVAPQRIGFFTGETTTRSERVTIKSNGNVGIGSTSPTSKLSVVGSVMVDDMLNIDPTSDRILLFGDDTVTSQVDFMQVSPTVTTQAHNTYGQRVSFTNSNTSGHAYSDGAILGELIVPTTNANNYTERQSGLYGLFRHYGTGRVSEGWGTYSVGGQYGAGVVDNLKAYVAHVYTDVASSGNINNAYGVYIKRPDIVGSGDVGNSYGLFLEDHATIGTSTSFGIYQDGNDTKSVLEGKVAFGYTDPGTARVAINGDVGIGTSSPTNKLTVASTGQTGPSIFGAFRIGEGTGGKFGYMDMVTNPATGNPYFYIQSIHSGTAFRDLILNPAGGNVGIGTTSPFYKLSVEGSGAGFPAGSIVAVKNTDVTGGARFSAINSSGNGAHFNMYGANFSAASLAGKAGFGSDTGIRIFTDANVQAGGSNDIELSAGGYNNVGLTVKSSGNVGIGTTSPSTRLHTYSTSNNYIKADVLNTGLSGFIAATDNVNKWIIANRNADSDSLYFAASPADTNGGSIASAAKLTLTQGGNIGIGTTTPVGYLSVAGSGPGTFFRLNRTDATAGFDIDLAGASANLNADSGFKFQIGDIDRGAWTVTGLGIGTTSPSRLLQVRVPFSSNQDNGLRVSSNAEEYSFDVGLKSNSLGGFRSALTMNTGASPVEALSILPSGNVGIGTTTPDVKLNVLGSSGTARTWTRNARTVASFENNVSVGTGISVIGSDSGYSAIFLGDQSAETIANFRYDHLTNKYQWFTESNIERMTLTSGTGNLGLATSTPSARLSVAGTNGGTAPILLVSTSTLTYATSTTLIIDSNGRVGVGTSSPNSLLEVNGSFHVEERTLATSTSMSIDFCNQDTSNNLRMQVGSANIAVTFTNFTSCVGKKITVRVASSNSGLIGSTTFSASTLYWDGYTSPSNNTTNGGMDEFIFDSTMGTSTPFIWGKLNSTLP